MENVQSGLKDISVTARKYYEDLIASGFSEEQAFILVRDWHKSMFGSVYQ
jgi:hypothetical protein